MMITSSRILIKTNVQIMGYLLLVKNVRVMLSYGECIMDD